MSHVTFFARSSLFSFQLWVGVVFIRYKNTEGINFKKACLWWAAAETRQQVGGLRMWDKVSSGSRPINKCQQVGQKAGNVHLGTQGWRQDGLGYLGERLGRRKRESEASPRRADWSPMSSERRPPLRSLWAILLTAGQCQNKQENTVLISALNTKQKKTKPNKTNYGAKWFIPESLLRRTMLETLT